MEEALEKRYLVSLAQRGDNEAFSTLVESHASFVRSLVAIYLGTADAADVAQEIWTAVYRKLWQLEDSDKFVPWLRKVIYYYCLNFRKARARQSRHETLLSLGAWERLVESVADDQGPMDEVFQWAELRALIHDELAGLPGDYGALLDLHYFKGLAYHQIAAVTGLPLSTIRWRLHQGRSLLRACLLSYMVDKEGY